MLFGSALVAAHSRVFMIDRAAQLRRNAWRGANARSTRADVTASRLHRGLCNVMAMIYSRDILYHYLHQDHNKKR